LTEFWISETSKLTRLLSNLAINRPAHACGWDGSSDAVTLEPRASSVAIRERATPVSSVAKPARAFAVFG